MSELSKTYEPSAIEGKWYAHWLEKGWFTADPHSAKEAYSIVIPPPNVTGVLTLGHVLNNTIQDILARRARMLGKEVLWLPGMDHAGIATQNVVEKSLRKSGEIKHRDDLGREKLVDKIWQWKEEYGGKILQQLRALGASCDWSRTRFTMDAEYSKCVQRIFVDLYQKGLIYRGKRMVNWCPSALTALSDEEVIMKPRNDFLYYFRVEIVEQPGTFLTIATTRPETIPGDTAIAVHPGDSRYAHLIGLHVRRPLPLENQIALPIVAEPSIDLAFGTGVLKVTPAHDKTDFEIGQRHQLPIIEVIDPRGIMNTAAGTDLAGLERFEARKKAVELLREMGALEREEPYQHNVGYSERADVPIEPRLSEQWFLKYPSIEQARDCVEQPQYGKFATIIQSAGDEFSAASIKELREVALLYAREHGFLGTNYINKDTGMEIRAGRASLSHSFSNRGEANIRAIAVLPELIGEAIWISSEPHLPVLPSFKTVHRFVAALNLRGSLYRVQITAKELVDGTIYYDHKLKRTAFGGKSLEAHSPKGKLDTQPAPNTAIEIRALLAEVNQQSIRFYPDRWAKVYDHWMGGIQDWCISRQLWWGHRIPVWYRSKTEIEKEESGGNKSPEEAGFSTSFALRPTPDSSVSLANICGSVNSNDHFERCQVDCPGEGWTQDPDVLDTWFSSWLWPFATMGWPEKTPLLQKFYPTTDLVTGPDIIFFWVARMIMAGYEWMGEIPFKNVYFTGIIRDKQGRKMSKSLGNSPDPLDLIAKFGADALRFGVMRSAPLGQDILFDEKNVELGRNFCTKLWNAARFRQMHDGKIEGEISPELLTSDDRWILLKLDSAIREVSLALDEYRFSDAAQALYRFFWSEYCDWYLEASKAALYGSDPALKANTLAVMDFIFAHTLRLFHPFLPFITEELWQSLGFREDLPAEQGGETIMFARWPKAFDEDFKAHYGLTSQVEEAVSERYQFIESIRHLRSESSIPARKKIRAVYQHPDQVLTEYEWVVIKQLADVETLELREEYQPARGEPVLHPPFGGALYLPLEGLVDLDAERERLQKEVAKVSAELEKVRTKLANPNFTEKVPAAVLEDHRQREAGWAEKLAQLQSSLNNIS